MSALGSFLAYALAFTVIERVAPTVGRPRSWRGALVDVAWYWIGEACRPLSMAMTFSLLWSAALVLGHDVGHHGFGPVAQLPEWVQVVGAILIIDSMGYVVHRLTHTVPWMWRFHAIHHSPTHLDWIAGARVHPLDTLVTRPFRTLPVLLLGFDPLAVAVVSPFFAFWNLFVHADIAADLGPLRHVVSTPRFHRWHHAAEGPTRNFAPLLPLWDLLGGTFFVPAEDTRRTGVDDDDLPNDLLGQLVFGLPWPVVRTRDRQARDVDGR